MPSNRPNIPFIGLEALEHELEVASVVQDSLLPKVFPAMPGSSFAGYCASMHHVGGDFYDVVPLEDGRALLVVADVMGKGVGAALFAAMLRALVRSLAERMTGVAQLLADLNRQITNELSAVDMFVTLQLAVVDPWRRQITVANAGHCPLLLSAGLGDAHVISPHGLPLGIARNATYAEEVSPLEASSCALLYTDGVTESRNPQGGLFGQERLELWLAGAAGRGEAAQEMVDSLLGELQRFQAYASPSDDQTFLIFAGHRA